MGGVGLAAADAADWRREAREGTTSMVEKTALVDDRMVGLTTREEKEGRDGSTAGDGQSTAAVWSLVDMI